MKKLLAFALLAAAGQAARAQSIPCLPGSLSTGVAAFYSFGSGSLNDLSGNGHTLINPTTANSTADRFGALRCAYHFDATAGDFLQIPAGGSAFLNNLTTSAFSISLWYRPTGPANAGAYSLLVGRGPTSGLHCPNTWGEWSIGLYDCRKAVVGFDQYSTWQTTTLDCANFMTSVMGNWHHLAFVREFSGARRLYVNGTLFATMSGPCGPMSGNLGDLMLGVGFTGDLDDIVIYQRPLTPGEVNALRIAPSCCQPGRPEGMAKNAGEEFGQDAGIILHPNPTIGHVSVTAGTAVIRSVGIYTSTGQLVGTLRFDATQAQVDLYAQPAGMYLLKVTTDKGTSIHKVRKN